MQVESCYPVGKTKTMASSEGGRQAMMDANRDDLTALLQQ